MRLGYTTKLLKPDAIIHHNFAQVLGLYILSRLKYAQNHDQDTRRSERTVKSQEKCVSEGVFTHAIRSVLCVAMETKFV